MTNPFEDADALYRVIVNNEGQYSLWPEGIAIPDGWVAVHGTDSHAECLAFVEAQWDDMRPKSLIRDELAAESV